MLERGGAENIAHSSSNQMSFKPRALRNSVFPPLSMLNATVWFAKCAFLYHILGWPLGFSMFLAYTGLVQMLGYVDYYPFSCVSVGWCVENHNGVTR